MLILLVDDNRTVRAALRILLTRLGHDVRVANSAATARIAFGVEPFDLIISDAELGDGDGLELLSSFRRNRPIPAVVISADPPDHRHPEAYDVYLVKPIRADELRDALQIASGRVV